MKSRLLRLIFMLILPWVLMLACAINSSAPLALIRPTEPSMLVEVTVVYRASPDLTSITSPTAAVTGVPTPMMTPSIVITTVSTTTPAILTNAPLIPPTDTPRPRPTATPSATSTPIWATPTMTVELVTPENNVSATQIISSDTGENVGVIGLVGPDQNISYAANVGGQEFKWHWSGGCNVPEGHGFQIRIWPAQTGATPLGVMDVTKEQKNIGCNIDTNIFSYYLNNLKSAPGVKETHIGKFLWDVAYVKLDPYVELTTSPPRLFEITLKYDGPLDPFGADLNCDNFPSWAEAQAVFIAAGGHDPHDLDPDGNGIACDELR